MQREGIQAIFATQNLIAVKSNICHEATDSINRIPITPAHTTALHLLSATSGLAF